MQRLYILDEQRRIRLPDEELDALGWQPGDIVRMIPLDSGVILSRHVPFCSLCGKRDAGVQKTTRGTVCPACSHQMREQGQL